MGKKTVIFVALLIFTSNTFVALSASIESYINQGDLYHSNFNNIKALETYQKAYDINSYNFEIIKKLIIASNDCGEDLVEIDDKKAREFFKLSVMYTEIAKDKFPHEKELYLLMGLSYGNSSRYAGGKEKVKLARDVEKNFKKMIELKPDYAPPYIGLGIYYREVANLNFFLKFIAKSLLGGLPNGTLEDSEAMLIKAVELAPDRVFTHYELAITYLDIGKTEKVKYHLNKVLELPDTDHLDPLKKKTAKKILRDLNS